MRLPHLDSLPCQPQVGCLVAADAQLTQRKLDLRALIMSRRQSEHGHISTHATCRSVVDAMSLVWIRVALGQICWDLTHGLRLNDALMVELR